MPYLGIWVRILKNYCHILNQHPRICLTAKFRKKKKKMAKFRAKNALFRYFGLEFEKLLP